MTARRRKPRPPPPVPALGHYVLAYQAADGSMQDPPIPLDERLTDAELRELVDGIQAKLAARQSHTTSCNHIFSQATEIYDGMIRIKDASCTYCGLKAAVNSTVSRTLAADTSGGPLAENLSRSPTFGEPNACAEASASSGEATPRVDDLKSTIASIWATVARGPSAIAPEEASAPPVKAVSPPPQATPERSDDTWWEAVETLLYRGACLLVGGLLLGAGTVIGGISMLKALKNWLAG
jgi:hypothetical protein